MKKRVIQIAVLVYLSVGICFVLGFSGCCTEYVHNLGKMEVTLIPTNLYDIRGGDIIVEVEVIKESQNPSDKGASLGKRLLILDGPHVGGKITVAIVSGYVRQTNGIYAVQVKEVSFGPEIGWRHYPPGILARIGKTALSPETQGVLREFRFSHGTRSVEFERQLDGTNYVVNFEVCGNGVLCLYQAKWAYPLKIFYVPAVVVDILFFPIEFIWFMNTGLGAR